MSKLHNSIKKVLLLGSGALKIGEAGEFDYSGSQAIKALKEEGIEVILVNPNVATIQTSKGLADNVYFLPVTPHFVEKVIEKEKPDGIFLSFGGQTALNCGIELYKTGVLKKHNIAILGTPMKAILDTEDRKLFVDMLSKLNLRTPKSIPVTSVSEGIKAALQIGFPVVLRGGFALGGAGSAVSKNKEHVSDLLEKALSSAPQVLVEEYLGGWKEIEYEIVRDRFDNCITVCNMENIDPMGIHTGESIVVAPSQTLTNTEYFNLREIAIKCIRGIGIVGECNIQFAVNPKTFEYRIIEVNARLSRSSALASKATGYPLAFVAAKLALGYGLFEVKNSVTGVTKAFFEPALDYVVVKIPRWDLVKFQEVHQEIGTEMKSVGEVMAIGRSFEEALQKAVRSLALGYEGLIPSNETLRRLTKNSILEFLHSPKVGRLNMISAGFLKGITKEEVHKKTGIDYWFLNRIEDITRIYKELKKGQLSKELLLKAKQYGFSDAQIAFLQKTTWKDIRKRRKQLKIIPRVNQIDTLAGEFPATTNYLYMTYNGFQDDIPADNPRNIAVLGSGPYHIGSSVEFDWGAVTTVQHLRKRGYETTVINCNPETVSTDYDISDRLYFEELTLERVLDIYEKERFLGLILSVGGQTPNNLSSKLSLEKVPILGTKTHNIDKAEDRNKFSSILDTLKIPQPVWESVTSEEKAFEFSQKVGFPLLLRPSYVLSGSSMRVVHAREDLKSTLKKINVTRDHPLVISQFIEDAEELEIDGVSDKGKIIAFTILNHIENAGVHSGDATIVIGKNTILPEVASRIEEIASEISRNLSITGPFNIQFLVKHGVVLVIECNVRASRSFPLSSKSTGVNLIELATDSVIGRKVKPLGRVYPHSTMVKSAQFSFGRLRGADPVLQIEMSSTGEVACFGNDTEEAYLKSLLSVGLRLPKKHILLTVGNAYKADFMYEAKILHELGFELYATEGTATYLKTFGVPTKVIPKGYEGGPHNVLSMIKNKKVDFIINIRDKEASNGEWRRVVKERSDGYRIRRAAADHNIPLITNLQVAKLLIGALSHKKLSDLHAQAWDQYVTKEV